VVSGPEEGKLAERLTELEIETAVYERLLHAEGVDARWIRVLVVGRVVRLTGSVPDSNQKDRAAALVASIAGVEKVLNELGVSHRAARVSGLDVTLNERHRGSGHWNPTSDSHGKRGEDSFHAGDIRNLEVGRRRDREPDDDSRRLVSGGDRG
jgi:hypothetical protein